MASGVSRADLTTSSHGMSNWARNDWDTSASLYLGYAPPATTSCPLSLHVFGTILVTSWSRPGHYWVPLFTSGDWLYTYFGNTNPFVSALIASTKVPSMYNKTEMWGCSMDERSTLPINLRRHVLGERDTLDSRIWIMSLLVPYVGFYQFINDITIPFTKVNSYRS